MTLAKIACCLEKNYAWRALSSFLNGHSPILQYSAFIWLHSAGVSPSLAQKYWHEWSALLSPISSTLLFNFFTRLIAASSSALRAASSSPIISLTVISSPFCEMSSQVNFLCCRSTVLLLLLLFL